MQADISRLNRFGVLNSIDSLADGRLADYDGVLMQPYALVFAKQQMNMERAAFQKRLRKVYEKK